MKVELTNRAKRSIMRIATRWRRFADHPATFEDELDVALEVLARNGGLGIPTRKIGVVYVLLAKSRCRIYFRVNHDRGVISIVEVWNAQRGREPKL